ncbi:MAG TPA: type II toxin-antitoxin system PemK/MazF family toxin [Chloroflexota bacterium]
MKRGEVYDARLDPTEGSEQAGSRPVIIVSRDALHDALPVVIAVPCSTMRPGRRIYPTHVLIAAPDGGLDVDSLALCEQIRVLSKSRLRRMRGTISPAARQQIDRALLTTLDLPGQV